MMETKLEELTREELIGLVLAQAEQIERLQVMIGQLKADNELLGVKLEKVQQPPTSSRNSSQPPSRDQKGNKAGGRPKGKHGPPAGHVKHERRFVAEPDQIVELQVRECPVCQRDLQGVPGVLVDVTQITEIPEPHAQVIEVRQYALTCPGCGQSHLAEPPTGLELQRSFGARLETTVVYYRQEQHMSYERTQETLLNLHQVTLSQGGIDQIMQRAGQAAVKASVTIQEAVRQSGVVNSDETGARVNGRTWWHWVFCTLTAVLHLIQASRASQVIEKVMGEVEVEVWGSDCLPAQLKAKAQHHQLCLAHQLRNLQAVVDRYPTLWWAQAMQTLLRAAIHLHHQRAALPPDQFQQRLAGLEQLTDWLLKRPLSQPEALKLQRRYLKHRQSLFVFLYRTDVPPTNNVSERALRPAVVHRKVTGGFRSAWGAEAYAALASVIDTAALQGVPPFAALQPLMGSPALPLPGE
jgi:transposase